jgi:outer membrane beta-barrel protein
MPRSALTNPVTLLGRAVAAGLASFALLGALSGTARAESPGLEAIERYKSGHGEHQAVENRFFLKGSRFEISPVAGYVPNNPFARRYMFGGILGYHFNELISVQAAILYSPDLGEGDLKGLTSVLLERAYQADNTSEFQQPLDKAALTGAFGVAWAPLYGKINLVGETVLNFDFYMFAGAGMISKQNYVAQYSDANIEQGDIVELTGLGNEVVLGPYLGIGQNYFVNRVMAVKIDVRAAFYVDNQPQYDPNVAPEGLRLYNNVIASGGVALFFPRMKRQLYEF